MHIIPLTIETSDSGCRLALDGSEHDTDTLECWCNPTIQRPCHECLPDGIPQIGSVDPNEPNVEGAADVIDGCWACNHGWVTVERWAACADSDFLLIIHNSE